jgi:NAD(P)-dependent dehydrogenase (short-subunit alcohol dehydrogenase family)
MRGSSRAALNMLTVQLSEELRDTGIKINSVSPGFVKTDLTGYGTMAPAEGARLPVNMPWKGMNPVRL